VSAITPEFIGGGGGGAPQPQLPGLDGKIVEQNLVGMLTELKKQSATLGSLDALRQADFSGVQDKVKTMNSVYNKLTMAMESMTESIEDTKMYKQQMEMYKEQIKKLNDNLTSLNGVYGGMLSAMRGK
jgi:peptidoglycan hydrolase CwlO-like protein